MSTAGGQDKEGTADAVPSWVTLPDDLLTAADQADAELGRLMRAAAHRICDLEEDRFKLRSAIVRHRGHRDYVGGKIQSDVDLWEHVADVPWGKPIKGDG